MSAKQLIKEWTGSHNEAAEIIVSVLNNGTLKGFIAFKGSCLATMQDKYKRLEQQGHKLKLIRGK